MKKRVSIYIDEGVWNATKQEAYRRGAGDINKAISASQFTEDALKAFLSVLPGALNERSITFVNTGGEPFKGHPETEAIYPDEKLIGRADELESEIIENGQKNLLKKRLENQAELDKNREELVRKKGETSAAWLIRKKEHPVGLFGQI